MSSTSSFLTQFPSQKQPRSKKTQEWAKQCLDSLDGMLNDEESQIRSSLTNKINNYNLYSGIFDKQEMINTFNPMKLKGFTMPTEIQNYPVEIPKFNLLIGEEMNRGFNWRLRAANQEAVSDKERLMNEGINAILMEQLKNPNMSEAEFNQKIAKNKEYFTYTYQDKREKMGTNILKYLWYEEDLKRKFNEGFKDVLIGAEELYDINILSGQPTLRRVNTKNIVAIRSGESHFIEDSSMIMNVSYRPLAHILDDYHADLTQAQVTALEDSVGQNRGIPSPSDTRLPIGPVSPQEYNGDRTVILIDGNQNLINAYGGNINIDGNIREVSIRWKSMRKIGFLTYIDEDGEERKTTVDERYQIDKDAGDKIRWEWISEWWEGVKLSSDIYIRMRPREVQFRKVGNPSLCSPGYVGTYYATNDSQAVSLMDRVKPLKYTYNLLKARLMNAISRYNGPIVELDISKKPKSWKLDKWLYYTEMLNYMIVDPFTVKEQGVAKGKLAGSFNTTGRVMNPDFGNYIQHMGAQIAQVEVEIDNVAGVSKQRQGQIENRETTRGIERSVTQSSHITEEWFNIHEHTKLRAMTALLETAKVAWRHDKKKLSYIDDQLGETIFEADVDMLADSDIGLFLTDGKKEEKLLQIIEAQAQNMLANDKMKFSTLMSVISEDSLSAKRNKVVHAEEQQDAKEQEQYQQQLQSQEKMNAESIQKEKDLRQMEIDFEQYKIDSQIAVKEKEIEGKLKLEDDKQEQETSENALDRELEREKFNLDGTVKTNIANDNNKTKKEVEDKKVKKQNSNK